MNLHDLKTKTDETRAIILEQQHDGTVLVMVPGGSMFAARDPRQAEAMAKAWFHKSGGEYPVLRWRRP